MPASTIRAPNHSTRLVPTATMISTIGESLAFLRERDADGSVAECGRRQQSFGVEKAGDEPRRNADRRPAFLFPAGKRHEALGAIPLGFERQIFAISENTRVVAPRSQARLGEEELDAAIGPGLVELAGKLCAGFLVVPHLLEDAVAGLEIDGPAIVRVDERKVPQLAALVDVRHARGGELQHQLR